MDHRILTINTRIPPRPPGMIRRDRIVEAVEAGLERASVVLISAPAGYGKTTLLADWAHATHRKVAWLTVEPEQNDSELLLRYLVSAWSAVDPEIRETTAGLILEPMAPDVDLAARLLVNFAARASIPVTFALDDLHLIHNQATASTLTTLIEHLPPEFKCVATCRSAPSLPLVRWRVRGQLTEIGRTELAFRNEEARRFLERALGRVADERELAEAQTETEGWVAALRLSVPLEPGTPRMAQTHHEIGAYLSTEVLTNLDDEIRRFLLQTSVLDRLSGPLCDAVTGGVSSQTMLDRLEADNLFLQAIDTDRTWYRLHPLLREVLRPALAGSDKAPLHARAAQWFLEQRMADDAFRHAVAAGNPPLSARIAESWVVAKLEAGEYRTVQGWVDSVPVDWYTACPELNILRIAFSVFSGDIVGSIAIMDELDGRLQSTSSPSATRLSAKMAVARCAIACFLDQVPTAESYAARALRDLDVEDVTYRANTHHALADTYRRHSRWDDAMDHYRQVLDLSHDPAFPLRSAHVYGAVADLELRQGHLHEAAKFWQKNIAAIQRQQNWGKLPVPIIGWASIRYGELLYEWNQLDNAASKLDHGLERAELGGDARTMLAGYLLATRLRLAAGDLPAAADYVQRAEALAEHAPFPEWLSRLDRARALVFVHQENSSSARAWWKRVESSGELANRPENQEAYLGLAHVMTVFGDDADRSKARHILMDQLFEAETAGRLGIVIEALALLALAHQAAGNDADALITLERALRLAEPEGPIRLFLDLGLPMMELLRGAERRGVLSEYGGQLRAASTQATSPSSSQLVEPLSEREIEILRLAAAGLTNRETADRLYISAETVKTHLGNIYAKLGVHRRIEAAARARELGLLH